MNEDSYTTTVTIDRPPLEVFHAINNVRGWWSQEVEGDTDQVVFKARTGTLQDHRAAIEEYVEAGYDHVYVHQVGPDQDGFFDFYEREILPSFR